MLFIGYGCFCNLKAYNLVRHPAGISSFAPPRIPFHPLPHSKHKTWNRDFSKFKLYFVFFLAQIVVSALNLTWRRAKGVSSGVIREKTFFNEVFKEILRFSAQIQSSFYYLWATIWFDWIFLCLRFSQRKEVLLLGYGHPSNLKTKNLERYTPPNFSNLIFSNPLPSPLIPSQVADLGGKPEPTCATINLFKTYL